MKYPRAWRKLDAATRTRLISACRAPAYMASELLSTDSARSLLASRARVVAGMRKALEASK